MGTVHDQGRAVRRPVQPFQELPPLRGIVRVAGEEREGHGCSGIRGSQMKPGVPPAPGLADADALRAVFSRAPCHWDSSYAGAVETQGLDLIRIIRSRCSCLNTRSRTPFFDHHFNSMDIKLFSSLS